MLVITLTSTMQLREYRSSNELAWLHCLIRFDTTNETSALKI